MRPASTPSGRTPLVNGGNRKHRNGAQTGFLSDRDKQPEESPQRHGKSNGSGNKAGTVKAHRKMWFQLVFWQNLVSTWFFLVTFGFNWKIVVSTLVFVGKIWFQLCFFY